MITVYVLPAYSFFCIQMEENPYPILNRNPVLNLLFIASITSWVKFVSKQPVLRRPVGILAVVPWTDNPRADYQTWANNTRLCVRPNWPLGPEHRYPLILKSVTLHRQIHWGNSYYKSYPPRSSTHSHPFDKTTMLQHFVWHFWSIPSEIWQTSLSSWAAKQAGWSGQQCPIQLWRENGVLGTHIAQTFSSLLVQYRQQTTHCHFLVLLAMYFYELWKITLCLPYV